MVAGASESSHWILTKSCLSTFYIVLISTCIIVAIHLFEDYTQTSENKLSSASTWYVNVIRYRQKFYRYLEMPKNNSSMSYPPCKLWHICVFGRCQLLDQSTFAQQNSDKLLWRREYCYVIFWVQNCFPLGMSKSSNGSKS